MVRSRRQSPHNLGNPRPRCRSIKTNIDIALDQINRTGRYDRRRLGNRHRRLNLNRHKVHAVQIGQNQFALSRHPPPIRYRAGINSYRLATALTVPPSISVSATIRAFSSGGQSRLPSDHRGTLARISLVAPIEKLPKSKKSQNRRSSVSAKVWGRRTAYPKTWKLY
ncbi:hypothetical protein SAMN04488118_11563 [Epibacterium ulvae]|uniref:Uncharacterized protein n=1 Tax=Epibacterium ulvae TaxID=1156985 RepID=A0A1G5RFM1_9RHOB|nr:hypothetical protein SAMN04488118_11563 [Epibacterium ulvae]